MNYSKAFTLIELIVVIAIIAVLSAIILFSITQYINKGKDSNIAGNLAVLIPAGEVYYNIGNTYADFCAQNNNIMQNALSQMPSGIDLKCFVEPVHSQSWAACVQEFTDNTKAFCVDSRGMKREIDFSNCNETIIKCQ